MNNWSINKELYNILHKAETYSLIEPSHVPDKDKTIYHINIFNNNITTWYYYNGIHKTSDTYNVLDVYLEVITEMPNGLYYYGLDFEINGRVTRQLKKVDNFNLECVTLYCENISLPTCIQLATKIEKDRINNYEKTRQSPLQRII